MASTISNINTALVDQRVVEALRNILPVLAAFSYRVAGGELVKNNVVRVPLAVDPTVSDKTAGTIVTGTGRLTGTDVTLDHFRGAGWDAKESEIGPSLLPQYWADKAAGAVYGCAKDIVDHALELITAANFSNADADKLVVAPADFGQNDMAVLWGKGVTKAKRQSTFAMLNTAYAASLFGDSALAQVFASSGENFLKTGVIPSFIGMRVAHYADFPSNSENLGGAVIGRAALAVAIASPSGFLNAGEGNIVDRRIITEPDSGISCMYTVTADGGGILKGEVAVLFGVAAGQNSVVRLLSE